MKHYKEIPQLGHTQPLCIAVDANEKKDVIPQATMTWITVINQSLSA